MKTINKIIPSTQSSSKNLFPSPSGWLTDILLIASHPLVYFIATISPLFFHWNRHILLIISLTSKGPNLTTKSVVSKGQMYAKNNYFPCQWQRRKCFSLYNIKVHNQWYTPWSILSPWKRRHIFWAAGWSTQSPDIPFPNNFLCVKKTYLNGVGCTVSSLSLGWTKPLVAYFDVRAPLLLAEAPEGPSNLIFLLTLRSHVLLYFICPKNKYLCATLPISSTERHFSEGKASYMYIVSWNELAHSSLTPQGMLISAQLGLSVTLRG